MSLLVVLNWRAKRALSGKLDGKLCVVMHGLIWLYVSAIRSYTGEYAGDFTYSIGYGRLGDFAPDSEMVVNEDQTTLQI